MNGTLYAIMLAVALVVLLVLAFLVRKPLRFIGFVAFNLLLGILTILALNWLLGPTIAIPLNVYTLICSAGLGIPGGLLLAAMQFFL